jgi:SAM-dependent methyltransferase
MGSASPRSRRDLKSWWEIEWANKPADGHEYFISEPPEELRALVENKAVGFPPGAALDLGCGAGVVTSYLTRHFERVVGLDIAAGALRQTRRRFDGEVPLLVVGDARALPLAAGAFALVFDRGCLQQLPQPSWNAYLRDVHSLLAPGGIFELFVSKDVKERSPSWKPQRAAARIRALGRRERPRGPEFLTRRLVEQLLRDRFETIDLTEPLFRTSTGKLRGVIRGTFRKASA